MLVSIFTGLNITGSKGPATASSVTADVNQPIFLEVDPNTILYHIMNVRELTTSDLQDIANCIYHHKTMYSVNIDHSDILKKVMYELDTGKVWGCYDGGQCVGFATQHFWPEMPVWTFSNVFVTNTKNLLLTEYFVDVISRIMTAAVNYAESMEIFEFYYVLRDNKSGVRKATNRSLFNIFQPELMERYEIENIHVMSSHSDIKWGYQKRILGQLGILAVTKGKTLIVRRGRLKKSVRELD